MSVGAFLSPPVVYSILSDRGDTVRTPVKRNSLQKGSNMTGHYTYFYMEQFRCSQDYSTHIVVIEETTNLVLIDIIPL